MRIAKLLGPLLALLVATALLAQEDGPLRDDHPRKYTVQPGDTLWDISGRFLKDPWLWPEIWYENPDIDNPHLIFPGDVLTLTIVDGERRITVQERGGGTVKLSPQIRVQDLDEAIQTIPIDAIRPFLSGNRVVSRETYNDAPYIVAGADERVMGATGDTVYARGLSDNPQNSYSIVREAGEFVDPETGEVLGIQATYIGDVQLIRSGDPASLRIAKINREALPGDRLLVTRRDALKSRYYPRAPADQVRGVIMSVMDGVSEIGQFNVVAINRGASDGLEQGHVLAAYQSGRTVRDRWADEAERVTLPDERAGEMILFRVYEDMSFALIMEATRAMNVGDTVRNP